MRLLSIGFGKVKALQCYVYLILWLILVSVGLYWFLNRSMTEGSSALTQSGFGYIESNEIVDSTHGDGSESVESSNHHVSSYANRKNHLSQDRSSSSAQTASANMFEPNRHITGVGGNNRQSVNFNNPGKDVFEEWMKKIGMSENSGVARLCNPTESIKAQDENIEVPDYKLEALVILFRHGDRGPLTHIGRRNVSHINCEAKSPDLERLKKFATDTISKLPGYSQFVGPFHSFPKVPISQHCSLGQLTQQGSHQLLTLGKMIRSTYKSTFFDPVTSSSYLNSLKVLAYSSRYRRTFQSLFAFLFGLLGPKQLIQSATIRESQSIMFCFHDCSCRAADKLKKTAAKKYKPTPEYKSILNSLVTQLNTVLGTEKSKKSESSLLDSLLVYPCHKMELPCQEDNQKDKGVKYIYKAIKKISSQYQGSDSPDCVNLNHLEQLIKLIRLENQKLKENKENHKFHLLGSYGLLKEIVNVALKMTSTSTSQSSRKQQLASSLSLSGNGFGRKINSKTKIVIFSGHDTTLQSITAALGIFSPDTQLPPFASRLIFEFYRKTNTSPNSPRKHYFRVVYNGNSLTHLVTFCKNSTNFNYNYNSYYSEDSIKTGNTKTSSSFEKERFSNKTFLCPVEYLVRFLHDHYFDSFGNTTNFKDACQL